MNKPVFDVVYRRCGGVGVAVIRRDGEDLLMWVPDQNLPGQDGEPLSHMQAPGAWGIADQLSGELFEPVFPSLPSNDFGDDDDDDDDFDDDDFDDENVEDYGYLGRLPQRQLVCPSRLEYFAAWGVKILTFVFLPINAILLLLGFIVGAFGSFWRDGLRLGAETEFFPDASDTIREYKAAKALERGHK